MRHVVFVAPYFLDATERFLDAATRVPEARLGLVSCDPVEKLPAETRARLSAHYAVKSIELHELQQGVTAIRRHFGAVDRLLAMLEQIQVPIGEIRDRLGIPGMGAATAQNFRDKAQMKSVLRKAHVPCARHRLVSDVPSGVGFAKACGYPLIIKPPAGAGAKGTFRCENEDNLVACLHSVRPTASDPVLIEEFIQGKEHSFDSVCINGTMVWHSISHYFPGPLEVVREPWIQWCVIIPRETDAPHYQTIRQIAQPALSALGMHTGLSHMEWFLRPDGSVAISEVGARPPGAQFTTLMSYAHDTDMYRAWAELMIYDRFPNCERRYAAGAAYLRGMGQGQVANVTGLQEIARELGEIVVESRLPKLGQLPSGSYEGEGYIIVRHPDTQVVASALQKIVSTVHVELRSP
jgi:D-alanine-D-alanine ligase-like ATP-grasp enzyme